MGRTLVYRPDIGQDGAEDRDNLTGKGGFNICPEICG